MIRIEHTTYGGVGDLHAEHRGLGGEGAHAEGDDVHRAAAHRPAVEVGHDGLHLARVHPVVGRAGVVGVHRADVGAVLDAGHVGGIRGAVEGVRLLVLGEAGEGAGGDELVGEPGPLLVRAVAPDDLVRLGQGGDLLDPGGELGVLGGGGEGLGSHWRCPFRGGARFSASRRLSWSDGSPVNIARVERSAPGCAGGASPYSRRSR